MNTVPVLAQFLQPRSECAARQRGLECKIHVFLGEFPHPAEHHANRFDGGTLGIERRQPLRDRIGVDELRDTKSIGPVVDLPAPLGPARTTMLGTLGTVNKNSPNILTMSRMTAVNSTIRRRKCQLYGLRDRHARLAYNHFFRRK